MAPFKQGGSSKYHEYMNELIHKIHEAEEMLLSGDERHLEALKEVRDMIEDYTLEAQGHKFEPMPYQNMQGRQQQGQPSNYDRPYTDFPQYPEMPNRGRDVRGHLGYIPYYPSYPFYPFYNESGRGGSGQGGSERRSREGYNDGNYPRR